MAPRLNIDRISWHDKGIMLNTRKCLLLFINVFLFIGNEW